MPPEVSGMGLLPDVSDTWFLTPGRAGVKVPLFMSARVRS